MIKYTSISPIRLAAFGNGFQQLFVGSPDLVYVAITQALYPLSGYTYTFNFFVDELPKLEPSGDVDSEAGFVVSSNTPNIFKIDNGLPIVGTWYGANQTNTFAILNIILGHKV